MICEACNGTKQVMMRVQYVNRACAEELRPCPLCTYQKCDIFNCCMRAVDGAYCEGHTPTRPPLGGDR